MHISIMILYSQERGTTSKGAIVSTMFHIAFLLATVLCAVVEAAPGTKDTVINGVAKNEYLVDESTGTSDKLERSSIKGNVEVQEARTVICPPGYEPIEIYCYKINLQLGEHRQHRDLCFQSGGYLIEILSKEENAALVTYMKGLNLDVSHHDRLHIGLVDFNWCTQSSPLFRWLYNYGLPYENWAPGHPLSQECAFVNLQEELFGKWGVYNCHRLYGGICEANPLAKLSLEVIA